MSKIYAIKFADGTHWLGDNWPDCEKLVNGKTGVKYKSFAKLEDARAWISGVRQQKKGLRIYVDGSYMPTSDYAGWSWVAVDNGVEIASACGKTPHPAASRNIDGELYAAWKAIEFLAKRKRKGVICHDYQGVASWATGDWKTNSAVSQIYVNRISDIKMWATFEKVSGHSGDEWNDRADYLAKSVLSEKIEDVDNVEKKKSIKPEKEAKPEKKAKPVKKAKPQKKAKPVKKVKLEKKAKPVKKVKVVKKVKSVKKAKLVKKAKPVKKTKAKRK